MAGACKRDTVAMTTRRRARDLGFAPGVLPPGAHNAITDVVGVRVGHPTLMRGDAVRTGVTTILPHDGNLFESECRPRCGRQWLWEVRRRDTTARTR